MKKQVLIKPVISEKSLNLAETANQYTFIVDLNVNKIEIKKAIEDKFGVKVTAVKTLIKLGKKVSFGRKRITGRKNSTKKAFVTLKSGDTISLFKMN